ncbi:hypothetical protein FB45DRAFT_297791 [Roridomyces roridus]|uniref:Uncharacterized protein n=1 Tax=Roridomyces roridus TaxID=1738132 RepID=A0AAD7CE21_9AGAR|nr:hypothetical protein FB45DRAFT_297791 [Roridomyces roridus]
MSLSVESYRFQALLQLGDMYNTRNTECAELKEALQRQEQPSPVTTQQTPPPTPPIQSRVFTAHSPPACDKPTVPVTWASLAANYKSKTLAAQDKKTERSQYLAYMSALPQPLRLCRPKFTDHDSVLQPVAKILDGYDVFSISYPNPVTRRDILHCPKRTLWCNQSRIHAIVVEPTHIFSRQTNRYVENHAMTRYCGKNSDRVNFFANKGEFVYYVGTYVVHSLRAVHPPSGGIPSDVSNYAIHNQMGMTEDEVRASSHLLPGGRVGTECFGMQCVGFDQDVYRMLRERFTNSGSFEQHPEQGLKRKAESEEEMRGEREVKLSRFA